MDVQQKPHPHSIEVILGLTQTDKRKTQSFRPYCRINDTQDCQDISLSSQQNEHFYTRLVPRLGVFPRPLAIQNTEFIGKTDNTELAPSYPMFKDSVNIKGNEEAERYLYTKSATAAENNVLTIFDDQKMKAYGRTMEQGIYFFLYIRI